LRRGKVFEAEEKRWRRAYSPDKELELQKLSLFEKF